MQPVLGSGAQLAWFPECPPLRHEPPAVRRQTYATGERPATFRVVKETGATKMPVGNLHLVAGVTALEVHAAVGEYGISRDDANKIRGGGRET